MNTSTDAAALKRRSSGAMNVAIHAYRWRIRPVITHEANGRNNATAMQLLIHECVVVVFKNSIFKFCDLIGHGGLIVLVNAQNNCQANGSFTNRNNNNE